MFHFVIIITKNDNKKGPNMQKQYDIYLNLKNIGQVNELDSTMWQLIHQAEAKGACVSIIEISKKTFWTTSEEVYNTYRTFKNNARLILVK